MQTSIALKVNQEKLVQELRHAFTDNHLTVLRELAQNARRAGATFVDITLTQDSLRVVDNGCGISDFAKLLSIAESGWDAETVEREHPYGLGFLSALYSAETVWVESGGQRMTTATKDILAFKPVAITPAKTTGHTVVMLTGISKELGALSEQIEHLRAHFLGFPIDVLINQDKVDRRDAPDRGRFVSTPVGHIRLTSSPTLARLWYYQGLPVYAAALSTNDYVVVHLDTDRYTARLPDRDTLVNHGKAENEVLDAVDQAWKDFLRAEKARLAGGEFVKAHFHHCLTIGCAELLNDIPCLPRSALSYVRKPWLSQDAYSFLAYHRYEASMELVSRSELSKKFIVNISDADESTMTQIMFAHLSQALFSHELMRLDANHWLKSMVLDCTDEDEFSVTLHGQVKSAKWMGNWTDGTVKFCEHYRIEHRPSGRSVTGHAGLFTERVTGHEGGQAIVYPAKESDTQVLDQVSSFLDENDAYDESGHDREVDQFTSFVTVHRANKPEEVLAAALRRGLLHDIRQALAGQRFTLSITKDGEPTVTVLLKKPNAGVRAGRKHKAKR